MEAGAVDVWAVGALSRDFPRLGETDYLADGVHLHAVHYRTIRAALEEEATVAALQRRHAALPPIGHYLARPPPADPPRDATRESEGEGQEQPLAPNDARHNIRGGRTAGRGSPVRHP